MGEFGIFDTFNEDKEKKKKKHLLDNRNFTKEEEDHFTQSKQSAGDEPSTRSANENLKQDSQRNFRSTEQATSKGKRPKPHHLFSDQQNYEQDASSHIPETSISNELDDKATKIHAFLNREDVQQKKRMINWEDGPDNLQNMASAIHNLRTLAEDETIRESFYSNSKEYKRHKRGISKRLVHKNEHSTNVPAPLTELVNGIHKKQQKPTIHPDFPNEDGLEDLQSVDNYEGKLDFSSFSKEFSEHLDWLQAHFDRQVQKKDTITQSPHTENNKNKVLGLAGPHTNDTGNSRKIETSGLHSHGEKSHSTIPAPSPSSNSVNSRHKILAANDTSQRSKGELTTAPTSSTSQSAKLFLSQKPPKSKPSQTSSETQSSTSSTIQSMIEELPELIREAQFTDTYVPSRETIIRLSIESVGKEIRSILKNVKKSITNSKQRLQQDDLQESKEQAITVVKNTSNIQEKQEGTGNKAIVPTPRSQQHRYEADDYMYSYRQIDLRPYNLQEIVFRRIKSNTLQTHRTIIEAEQRIFRRYLQLNDQTTLQSHSPQNFTQSTSFASSHDLVLPDYRPDAVVKTPVDALPSPTSMKNDYVSVALQDIENWSQPLSTISTRFETSHQQFQQTAVLQHRFREFSRNRMQHTIGGVQTRFNIPQQLTQGVSFLPQNRQYQQYRQYTRYQISISRIPSHITSFSNNELSSEKSKENQSKEQSKWESEDPKEHDHREDTKQLTSDTPQGKNNSSTSYSGTTQLPDHQKADRYSIQKEENTVKFQSIVRSANTRGTGWITIPKKVTIPYKLQPKTSLQILLQTPDTEKQILQFTRVLRKWKGQIGFSIPAKEMRTNQLLAKTLEITLEIPFSADDETSSTSQKDGNKHDKLEESQTHKSNDPKLPSQLTVPEEVQQIRRKELHQIPRFSRWDDLYKLPGTKYYRTKLIWLEIMQQSGIEIKSMNELPEEWARLMSWDKIFDETYVDKFAKAYGTSMAQQILVLTAADALSAIYRHPRHLKAKFYEVGIDHLLDEASEYVLYNNTVTENLRKSKNKIIKSLAAYFLKGELASRSYNKILGDIGEVEMVIRKVDLKVQQIYIETAYKQDLPIEQRIIRIHRFVIQHTSLSPHDNGFDLFMAIPLYKLWNLENAEEYQNIIGPNCKQVDLYFGEAKMRSTPRYNFSLKSGNGYKLQGLDFLIKYKTIDFRLQILLEKNIDNQDIILIINELAKEMLFHLNGMKNQIVPRNIKPFIQIIFDKLEYQNIGSRSILRIQNLYIEEALNKTISNENMIVPNFDNNVKLKHVFSPQISRKQFLSYFVRNFSSIYLNNYEVFWLTTFPAAYIKESKILNDHYKMMTSVEKWPIKAEKTMDYSKMYLLSPILLQNILTKLESLQITKIYIEKQFSPFVDIEKEGDYPTLDHMAKILGITKSTKNKLVQNGYPTLSLIAQTSGKEFSNISGIDKTTLKSVHNYARKQLLQEISLDDFMITLSQQLGTRAGLEDRTRMIIKEQITSSITYFLTSIDYQLRPMIPQKSRADIFRPFGANPKDPDSAELPPIIRYWGESIRPKGVSNCEFRIRDSHGKIQKFRNDVITSLDFQFIFQAYKKNGLYGYRKLRLIKGNKINPEIFLQDTDIHQFLPNAPFQSIEEMIDQEAFDDLKLLHKLSGKLLQAPSIMGKNMMTLLVETWAVHHLRLVLEEVDGLSAADIKNFYKNWNKSRYKNRVEVLEYQSIRAQFKQFPGTILTKKGKTSVSRLLQTLFDQTLVKLYKSGNPIYMTLVASLLHQEIISQANPNKFDHDLIKEQQASNTRKLSTFDLYYDLFEDITNNDNIGDLMMDPDLKTSFTNPLGYFNKMVSMGYASAEVDYSYIEKLAEKILGTKQSGNYYEEFVKDYKQKMSSLIKGDILKYNNIKLDFSRHKKDLMQILLEAVLYLENGKKMENKSEIWPEKYVNNISIYDFLRLLVKKGEKLL